MVEQIEGLSKGKYAFKANLILIYSVLAVLNIGAWVWAFAAFGSSPALLGVALLVYGLGLRHAVDADHIAAIDNVTRKLMQEGKRPVSVGFFFAMGHSTIVFIVAAVVASAAAAFSQFESVKYIGAVIGTSVSAGFLLLIAAMNIVIFRQVYATYKHVRAGGALDHGALDALAHKRGLMSRVLGPAFRLISHSWHMYPLGLLFGLGFDTSTEVAMLSLSASHAAEGLPFWSILVFPVLFAAGMSLVDTTDGVMMLGAYQWAFVKPLRKLYYNMTITLVSIIVAVVIGGLEAANLIGDKLGLTGTVWDLIGAINDNFNTLGFVIIGIFLGAWALSFLIYRMKRLDQVEMAGSV